MRTALALAPLVAAGFTAAFALAQPGALPRSTTDRPDDVTGPQVHVVYAVPSDGADRGLDTNGTLAASVGVFETWLAGQTGGKALRLDTYEGRPDITFVQLPETDAAIAARGAFVRDEIEADMRAAGLLAPDKIDAVYYDGTSTYACGGGAWPPALPGVVAAMYLHGTPSCDRNAFASAGGAPGYLEFGMLHELLHTLGLVAACAPHAVLSGHVSDDPRDLIYAGPLPWQPSALDVGHDDYYATGRPDCPDLANSPYLAPYATPTTTTSTVHRTPGPRICRKGERSTTRTPCRRR